jgi:outer membrane protein OmpA-like peptidoglycan-associated protein
MRRIVAALLACLTGLALAGFAMGTAAAAEDCSSAADRFDTAREAGDLGSMLDSYQRLQAAGCSEQLIYCAGNGVALAHLEAGYARADAGADVTSIKQELLDGMAFGAPWQLLVGLADLTMAEARARNDRSTFTAASKYYQDALNTISEPPICSGPSSLPSAAEIEAVHKRMTEALLLAPQFEVVRTRAGGCGGIFLQSIRGFTPTYRPLPINFEFDKSEFTPSGRRAAEQLLTCLLEEHPAEVTLSGHTDAKGSEGYNLALSERRLASVSRFLREGGFEGKLVLVPKGESEPFEADDPTQYDEAELDQLNRRVTLRGTVE